MMETYADHQVFCCTDVQTVTKALRDMCLCTREPIISTAFSTEPVENLRERNRIVKLTIIDWSIVAAYFAFNLAIGFYYKIPRRAEHRRIFSLRPQRAVVAGRHLHGGDHFRRRYAAGGHRAWWRATGSPATGCGGTSCSSGMLTVFFYARLWRRSGVMTDVEFAEIRYCRQARRVPARIPRALPGRPDQLHHSGLGESGDGQDPDADPGRHASCRRWRSCSGMIALTSFISTLSGLWGVLVTDLFQFVIKMAMVIVLAVVAVRAVGGIER